MAKKAFDREAWMKAMRDSKSFTRRPYIAPGKYIFSIEEMTGPKTGNHSARTFIHCVLGVQWSAAAGNIEDYGKGMPKTPNPVGQKVAASFEMDDDELDDTGCQGRLRLFWIKCLGSLQSKQLPDDYDLDPNKVLDLIQGQKFNGVLVGCETMPYTTKSGKEIVATIWESLDQAAVKAYLAKAKSGEQ